MVHHDKRRHKQCKINFFYFWKKHFPKSYYLFLLFGVIELQVQDELAKKWSWIRSDGPKVPKVRRNEKTFPT